MTSAGVSEAATAQLLRVSTLLTLGRSANLIVGMLHVVSEVGQASASLSDPEVDRAGTVAQTVHR